jgi:hypothetical protein
LPARKRESPAGGPGSIAQMFAVRADYFWATGFRQSCIAFQIFKKGKSAVP